MKTSEWGKTLLYTYKYFNRITDAIDKMVNQAALNSYFDYNQKGKGTLTVTQKILDLVERKKKIINMKVLVDKCLLACDGISGTILVERYIDNDSCDVIAQRHNINERTYYRRQESAEAKFYSNMVALGYDEQKLNEYLADEKWIIEVFEGYKKENLEDEMSA